METFQIKINDTTSFFPEQSVNFHGKNRYRSLLPILISFVLLLLAIKVNLIGLLQIVHLKIKGLCTSNVSDFFIEVPSLPLIGPLHHVVWNRNRFPYFVIEWAIKYGPTAKAKILGKDFVILNDPIHIQKLLMSIDPGHVKKPDFIYRITFPVELGDGLVASEPNIWKAHRSILFKAFTYEALKSYFPIFNDGARKLVADLMKENLPPETNRKNKTFVEMVNLSTFGIISHIVTGTDMVSASECSTFYENFHRCQKIVTDRLLQPWLLIDPIWKFHPLRKELDKAIDHIDNGIRTLLKKKRQQATIAPENEKPMFNNLMDLMMASNSMTDEEILIEMTTFLLAGHDTVSVSINFLMINLALNQQHQTACRKEIDKMFENLSQNEESSANEITMDSLCELKYLERCIKESLRLYPTIPLFVRELETSLNLDDNLKLESGVIVFVSPWALGRHPAYYPEPEKFDPERFSIENCKTRNSFAFIPFSGGTRNCIGWKMAMYEMKILAAYILKHFEISTTDTQEDIKLNFNIALSTDKKFNLILKNRQ